MHCDSGDIGSGSGAAHAADLEGDGEAIAVDVGAGDAGVDLVNTNRAGEQAAPIDDDAGFLNQGVAEVKVHGGGDSQRAGGRRSAGGHAAAGGGAHASGVDGELLVAMTGVIDGEARAVGVENGGALGIYEDRGGVLGDGHGHGGGSSLTSQVADDKRETAGGDGRGQLGVDLSGGGSEQRDGSVVQGNAGSTQNGRERGREIGGGVGGEVAAHDRDQTVGRDLRMEVGGIHHAVVRDRGGGGCGRIERD